MFCRDSTIRAGTVYGEVAAPIKCRSWNCPECGPERQRQLQSTCINGKPNRFITITCRRGQYHTPEDAAAAIAKAWRTVIQRWRRQQKWHRCEYICVFEPHASMWPHMHILWRGHWIEWSWLSDQMKQLLNSPRVHVSAIKSPKQAAFYVAQYFTKAPTKFGNSKRYWTSRKYGKPYNTDAPRAFPKGMAVSRVPQPIHKILTDWIADSRAIWHIKSRIFGWGELVDETTGEIFPRPPDAETWERPIDYEAERPGATSAPGRVDRA